MATKMTIDGNTAVSHIAYAFSDVAAIYPITPSSNMAEAVDEWAANGRENLFGQQVRVCEMQSEAGAAGAVHGSLATGALTSTFTASQGLLLMIPNMYKIAGELLPSVFHVSARAIAAHALSIFGDHQDVMACRQTGFAIMASASVQEAMDLALVSHIATLKASVPFLHFFDGFRTSHEVQKIDGVDYEEIASITPFDKISEFRARALNPEHPKQAGTAQNPDIYFQNREAANKYYLAIPEIVQGVMRQVQKLTGRAYDLFDYVGAPDAEYVTISMGSSCDAIEETVNKLVSMGEKVGLIKVRLYRPFSVKHFVAAIPAGCKRVCVLDRTKEAGSLGEPLYLDVCAALAEAGKKIDVIGGRYGLGSKEFTPTTVKAVYDNLKAGKPKNHFTAGIVDDVTHTSLAMGPQFNAAPAGTISCKFYGLGADGTVGANKNSIKIIGDHTDQYAQGYFAYDSKKSGGFTVSHLRFGKNRIQSPYLVDLADFVACHNPSYVTRYSILSSLREGGVFLLNSPWSAEEMEVQLPASMKRELANKKARFYNVDAIGLASKVGMGRRINTIMQAAFFKLTDIIPYAQAEKYMKDAVQATYGNKGEKVVANNFAAIDGAIAGLKEIPVPAAWASATTGAEPVHVPATDYYRDIVHPVLAQEGDKLPVSAFDPGGVVPVGTSQFEKRGIAVDIPAWIPENCIQCNQCSLVCPHGVIRPYLLDGTEKAPEGFVTKPAVGKEFAGKQYRLQISPLDCTGCGCCAQVCPAKNKALEMKPATTQMHEDAHWAFAQTLPEFNMPIDVKTVKNSQFLKPLFEFSGACTGCGETPYIKLLTQLFGDRMIIGNATGCSSIYGGSAPTCPYTVNEAGHGPAWANSLFEDTAEFALGFNLATNQRREKLADDVRKLIAHDWAQKEIKETGQKWLDAMNDGEASKAASAAFIAALEDGVAFTAEDGKNFTGEYAQYWDAENTQCLCDACAAAREVLEARDMFVKKSIWAFGGDGWAYDIGYGGLDHVLAMGEDVNILVMDTEVYSNTGGQASKATPTGSVAKFAASGKKTRKKDLGLMAMAYGYVYVASVGMGANMAQLMKAVTEAEAYPGPSILIAYAPCINHGFSSMSQTQQVIKDAVNAGYWPLYRYNPLLAAEGKNPLIIDSKDPTGDYQAFLRKESRYTTLLQQFPEQAEELFKHSESEAKARLAVYKKLAAE